MSYRAVWMRIRTSEERIGKPLVVREGKGSKLTPFADRLIKQFKRLHTIVEAESDEVYDSLISDHLS
jgi:molybdate transport system regulatory protein